MFKVLILPVFAFFGLFLMPGNLIAGNLNFSYAEYVHLSDAQQTEYVKTVMKLMVELEGQYKKDVRSGNIHSDTFKKYSKVFHQLQAFFLSEAHAAPGDWATYTQRYQKLLSSAQNNSVCIYGGWASSMVNGKCTHPSKSKYAKAYQTGGCGPSKLSCNPVIFGYKNKKQESVFCVSITDESRNSSLDCMNAALADPAEAGADPTKERLDDLKARLTPEIIDSIYGFAYKTCVCETGPAAMVGDYQDKIRPHRTCYGLMKMMGEVKNVCEDTSFTNINTDFFKKMNQTINDFGPSDLKCRDQNCRLDLVYQQFLSSYRSDKSNLGEMKRLCPADQDLGLMVGSGTTTGGTTTETNPPGTTTTGSNPPGATTPTSTTTTPTPPTTTSATPETAATKPVDTEECKVTCKPDAPEDCEFKKGDNVLITEGTPEIKDGKYQIKFRRLLPGQEDTPANRAAAALVPLTCSAADAEAATAQGKKLSISVTKKKTANQMILVTTVTGEGYKSGASITWYNKYSGSGKDGNSDSGKPNKGSDDKGKTVQDISRAPGVESDKPKDDKPKDEKKTDDEPIGDEIGTDPELKAERETEDYEVCAIAKKEGFETSDEQCVKVEKLSAKDAIVGPMQNQQPLGTGRINSNMGIR